MLLRWADGNTASGETEAQQGQPSPDMQVGRCVLLTEHMEKQRLRAAWRLHRQPHYGCDLGGAGKGDSGSMCVWGLSLDVATISWN